MKILSISLIVLVFINSLYACGGCVDSYLGSEKANEGKIQYDKGENQIANAIDKLNEIIKEEIIANEKNVLKEKEILTKLKTEKTLEAKKESFILMKNNQLQNIINNIKAKY
ncbi:hypothetical protein [Campylobacter sp. US50a]|nr:hypothetical protein [Campylobacter sp. US50a]ECL6143841.1 hypothetical protein [Campylobacter jejuni]ECO2639791.1 hypothetical protein [Campylobacter jejuni]TEX98612.1 hypothetical protein ELQ11_08695 [Campylobacter sp. US50a]HEC1903782.1 hypothetical protein [Campylobacter jejuni]HEC1932214.1 hypothetical protein [Campylobacter jejuni]